MRTSAVELAAKGLYVFRLRPGSKEVHKDSDHHSDKTEGWNLPSNDPIEVYERWTNPETGEPRADNIGVDTSKGLVVIDIDTKGGKVGADSWKAALAELGDPGTTYGVRTPSGGIHWYFAVDQAVSAHAVFGKDIDVRSHHGYVVGAGSVLNGVPYEELPYNDAIEPLPAAWKARTMAPRARAASQLALVELDTPEAILAAVRLLTGLDAPSEGSRDDDTFKAVCRVKDLGVSEGYCLELVQEHLNARASPPLPLSKVKQKVRSAYGGNSQNAPGVAHPDHQFGDVDLSQLPATIEKPEVPAVPLGPMFESYDPTINPATMPLRPWLVRNLLLRRNLTVIVAPGAAGKSTLTILWALAVITGRSDLLGPGYDIKQAGRVGMVNLEDDRDDIYRRIHVACELFGIDHTTLKDRLFVYSRDQLVVAARNKANVPARTVFFTELQDFVRDNKLDLLTVDPFVATHRLNENDNGEMDAAVRLYIEIARAEHIAVCLVHHTSKPGQASSDGFATSQHSARGASAIVNAARIVINFFPMSERDAQENGIAPNQRHKYARLDGSKMNFTLGTGEADWYERVNARHESGEYVGALRRVSFENARNREANAIVAAIVATWGQLDYAEGAPLDDVIAAVKDDAAFAGQDEKAIKKTLKRVLKEGQSDGKHTVWLRSNIDDRKHYHWTVTITEGDVDE